MHNWKKRDDMSGILQYEIILFTVYGVSEFLISRM